jgi:hypothetical protein
MCSEIPLDRDVLKADKCVIFFDNDQNNERRFWNTMLG